MAGIRLDSLVKQYPNGVRALDGIDLEIADGEFFALLGPSGCGKTTLLRTLAGLEQATAGRIVLGETDVTERTPGERDVAMVFQDYALLPHMDVVDNIAYPLRIRKVGREERRRRAGETGEGLSLGAYLHRRPAQLSGGQQQRVALARAIAVHPSVFLFDEPLSNLDARLRLEARTFLKRLQQDLAVTTVFVTHDQAEALAMADRMAVMEAGRIRQLGTPREVFQHPASTFVANFIGSTPMNLVAGRVTDGSVALAGARVPLPDGVTVAPGADVTVGLRPEYLELTGEADGMLAGRVDTVENLGATALVTLDCDGDLIGVVVPDEVAPEVGERCWARPMPGRVLVFDDAGELMTAARDRAGALA